MKKLVTIIPVIALIAFAYFWFAGDTSAQQFRSSSETVLRNGGTNNIFGVATITEVSNSIWAPGFLEVPKAESVALAIRYKLAGGTTNSAGSLFTLYRVAAGNVICSNSPLSFVIYPIAAGAATNYFVTNITLNALPGLYMAPIGNSNMYAMTNIYISYSFKN